jgi:glycine oxidase
MTRITVLGAGIIGLACADELRQRGHHVKVVDPAPGSGASHAAAGMLSPAGEFWHGEADLFRLGRQSAALWPAFAGRLGVQIHTRGTLLVGVDAGDASQVERQVALLTDAGIAAERMSRGELLAREPGLGRTAAGALLADDHSVDPREVVGALLARVPVVSTAPSQTDVTVVATGARLPAPFTQLVRPVRGEIVRVRTGEPMQGTVRAWVHGRHVYLVGRKRVGGPNGPTAEIVIGATSEEHDSPPVATVEGVFRLLESAREIFPSLDRAELVEAIARDRPGTRDNLPLIGPAGPDGVVLAAGHFRHGVLLAPLTAALVADHIESGAVDPAVDPRREQDAA